MSIRACSLLLVLFACTVSQLQCEKATPPEYRKLFKLPREQQAQEFKKYPLEQQVDIYIWAMKGVEPPATRYAGYLASNGKKVLPFILKRLKEEEWDGAKLYLIRALADMHIDHCSLKDEKEVIETVNAVISTMKDSFYRDSSKSELKKIIEQPGSSNSC